MYIDAYDDVVVCGSVSLSEKLLVLKKLVVCSGDVDFDGDLDFERSCVFFCFNKSSLYFVSSMRIALL